MEDVIFEQLPVKIETKKSGLWVLLASLVLHIPEIRGQCNCDEIAIERHLTQDDIAKDEAIAKANWDGINRLFGDDIEGPVDFSVTIADVKEKYIRLDIAELSEIAHKAFIEQLNNWGIFLDKIEVFPSDIVQIVEIPFMFLNLKPGDTEIHYKIFTKRCLSKV